MSHTLNFLISSYSASRSSLYISHSGGGGALHTLWLLDHKKRLLKGDLSPYPPCCHKGLEPPTLWQWGGSPILWQGGATLWPGLGAACLVSRKGGSLIVWQGRESPPCGKGGRPPPCRREGGFPTLEQTGAVSNLVANGGGSSAIRGGVPRHVANVAGGTLWQEGGGVLEARGGEGTERAWAVHACKIYLIRLFIGIT